MEFSNIRVVNGEMMELVVLSNRRFIEWWSCRVIVSSYGGVVGMSGRPLVEWLSWWSVRLFESSNGGVVKSSNCGMVELSIRRIVIKTIGQIYAAHCFYSSFE